MKKSQIQASIYTAIVMSLLLLLLILGGLTAMPKPEDEGVMISMGMVDDGFGTPTPKPVAVRPSTPPPPKVKPNKAKEKLMTQEDPSVALAAEKARKKKLEEDRKLKEKRRIEREKQLAEERRIAEEKRVAAEKKAKEEKAQKLANAFGSNTSQGKGQGKTTGDSLAGNPSGHGISNGHSWSLNGRSLMGSIVQPKFVGNQSGRVVVNIRVDAKGEVVSASIKGAGTTISNPELRQQSIKAARKTKFSVGKGIAYGTITYVYKLN